MKYLGINRDNNPKDIPEGYGVDAKHLVDSKVYNAVVNEGGFKLFQKTYIDEFLTEITYNKPFTAPPILLTTVVRRFMGEILLPENKFLVCSIAYRRNANVGNYDIPVFSEFGIVYEDGKYVPILRDIQFTIENKLNFNPQKPLRGESNIDVQGNTIAAVTDDFNRPFLINVTEFESSPILTGNFDINRILMFPTYTNANTNISISETGGSLPNAVYYFVYRYKNKDLSVSNPTLPSNPVNIFKAVNTSNISDIEGDIDKELTSKSITLNIFGLNTAFTEFEIIAISKRLGVVTAKIVKEVSITPNGQLTTVVDTYEGVDIDLAEVLVPRVVFTRVYEFVQVYNRLYAVSPSFQQNVNFQKAALTTRLQWVSQINLDGADTLDSINNRNAYSERSFLHREVYAFYLHYELLDGSVTPGYIIRNKYRGTQGELDAAKANSTLSDNQGFTAKVFQVEDTIPAAGVTQTTTLGVLHEIRGDFGYWENQDEFYPNTDEFNTTEGDYRNTNVLHHRFPSIAYIKSVISNSSVQSVYGLLRMDRLAVTIADVDIPLEIQPFVKGVFLSHAERDYNNSTLLGRSTMNMMHSYYQQPNFTAIPEPINNSLIQTGNVHSGGINRIIRFDRPKVQGNTTVSQRRQASVPHSPNYINTTTNVFTNETVFKFYDLDLIQNQPAIAPVYVANELFLARRGMHLSSFYITKSNPPTLSQYGAIVDDIDNQTLGRRLVNATFRFNSILGDLTPSPTANLSCISTRNNLIDGINVQLRRVKSARYVPERVNIGNIKNGGSENALVLTLDSTVLQNDTLKNKGIRSLPLMNSDFVPLDELVEDQVDGITGSLNTYRNSTYLQSLMANPRNCYLSFSKQKLVFSGYVMDGNFGIPFNGRNFQPVYGDGYTTMQTYHTCGLGALSPDEAFLNIDLNSESFGFKMLHTAYMTSKTNYLLLKSSLTNPSFRAYPKHGAFYIDGIGHGWAAINTQYNKDYNSINNLFLLLPFDSKQPQVEEYKNRIHRCVAFKRESNDIGWRTWLNNDYYETPRFKGQIKKVWALDRDLVIMLERASLITTGNEALNVSDSTVFVGSGNIFDKEAVELQPSKEGSLGSQHYHASISTMFGLIGIDAEKGIIFLVGKQGLKILSNQGLNRWFLERLPFNPVKNGITFQTDNPYTELGYALGIDYEYSRLLITKKDYEFTPYAISMLQTGRLVKSNNGFYFNVPFGNQDLRYEITYENEMFFINTGFTISYSFITNTWKAEHDYYPQRYFNLRNRLFAVKNRQNTLANNNIPHVESVIYELNVGKKGIFDRSTVFDNLRDVETAIPKESFITLVFNKEEVAKKFINLSWITEVVNSNGAYINEETFNRLLAFTNDGCTGEVTLLPFDFSQFFQTNIRNIKGKWNFNNLRNNLRADIFTNPNPPQPFIIKYSYLNSSINPIDLTKPFELRNPLIGYWMIIKLIYDNLDSSKEIRILQVNSKILPVPR
jgi:hypothetical protein